jgi:zinc transporter ZupT
MNNMIDVEIPKTAFFSILFILLFIKCFFKKHDQRYILILFAFVLGVVVSGITTHLLIIKNTSYDKW